MSLFSCIRSKSAFCIVLWLWWLRSNIRVITFKVLNRNTSLQVINAMSSDPYLDFLLSIVSRKMAKALWCELLKMRWLPPFLNSRITFSGVLPVRDSRVRWNIQVRVRFAFRHLVHKRIFGRHRHCYNMLVLFKGLRYLGLHNLNYILYHLSKFYV